MKAVAYSPGHITSFFEIADLDKRPLYKGSLGAGFCLDKGVTTTISSTHSKEAKEGPIIIINEKRSFQAIVSQWVYDYFYTFANKKEQLTLIEINHQIDLPQSSGFGTSGAAALSLAIALNRWCSTSLSLTNCAQIAHQAEVICQTGLGTIAGQYCGAIALRLKEGAPGVGKIEKIEPQPNYKCLVFFKGPISTQKALQDKEIREKSIIEGKISTSHFCNIKNELSLINEAARFSQAVNLIPKSLEELSLALNKQSITHGMLMFGEGLYTLYKDEESEEINKVVNLLKDLIYNSGCSLLNYTIDPQGGRIVHEL